MDKTTLTRRGVLGGAAAATMAGVLAGSGGLSPVLAATLPQPRLRQSDFAKLVGGAFVVQVGSASRTVTLNSVNPLAMANLPKHKRIGQMNTTGEQFSLQFSGPANAAFAQGTYTITTSRLGSFGLFLVPVGQPGAQQAYQAIIVSV